MKQTNAELQNTLTDLERRRRIVVTEITGVERDIKRRNNFREIEIKIKSIKAKLKRRKK